MNHSLEVTCNDTLIFHSDGRWLYPLFDLERFLMAHTYEPAELRVHDKIVGRAAALLLVRMGVGYVWAELMSELSRAALAHFGIPHTYDALVPRISCRTESLLAEELDVEEAYRILKARATASRET